MANSTKPLSRLHLLVIFVCGFFLLASGVSGVSVPSVPDFTLEFVDSSYDVPTTYSIEPFTGENLTQGGYHVEQTSIQLKIKNQPFTPYKIEDSKGNEWTINFYYNIRFKGHFSEDWIELYRASDGFPRQQSDLEYSLFSYVLEPDTDTIWGTKYVTAPSGGQVDFQVQAMIGYVSRADIAPWYPYRLFGETSSWSNTQTITITENIQTADSIPEFTSWLILPLVLIVTLSAILFRKRAFQVNK